MVVATETAPFLQQSDVAPQLASFLTHAAFARGQFLGDDPRIYDLTAYDRALVSAWNHGCPRLEMVIEYYGNAWLNWTRSQGDNTPYTPDAIRDKGIELTRRRYDECDFVTGLIQERTRVQGNDSLSILLDQADLREPGEPLGLREPGRVPASAEHYIPPLSKLVGFALSRILIEQLGWGFGVKRDEARYWKGLDMLDEAVKVSRSPIELLARLAELIFQGQDVPADKLFGHMLEEGIEAEQNNHLEFARVRAAIQEYCPQLRASLPSGA